MPERSNGAVSKTVVPFRHPGFESLSLRKRKRAFMATPPLRTEVRSGGAYLLVAIGTMSPPTKSHSVFCNTLGVLFRLNPVVSSFINPLQRKGTLPPPSYIWFLLSNSSTLPIASCSFR